ncbi:MAG: AAA family ATPase [Candidatus Moranbacteria bacterium CG23_combo_of_CG06-09_8_20_14_all_39_10]|nr:MAG: AAA family ATPase [Candidatus Moranbacteria bacterium CG23_combo_of_CG06-09_8_20_14_all_39_10]
MVVMAILSFNIKKMIKSRYLEEKIIKDLSQKMVFIGGPRQVGKTTLAKQIGKEAYQKFSYLNWDNIDDKKTILKSVLEPDTQMIIFDEIHKYRNWKNYIKGQFDKHHESFNILVTGSARLDLYKKGGDSLLGRYFYFRLHPFSVAEVLKKNNSIVPFQKIIFSSDLKTSDILNHLLEFGGFPEPFIHKDRELLRRWHNQRTEKIVKDDIRDVESIRDISTLQTLVTLLPEKVGSQFSINSLREDLLVSHKTISHWMDVLENFYYHFRISAYSAKSISSLRKGKKMYLWDWSEVPAGSARLENIIASHLLKLCHFLYDAQGYKTELHYLRDRDGHEVDFLIAVDKKPWMAIEVKSSDQSISKNLQYFGGKLDIPFKYQLVQTENVDFIQNDIRVMSVDKFLGALV